MPEIDPVSERLGTLTTAVQELRTDTSALSTKLDLLMASYAKEHDLRQVEDRVVKLEHFETQRKANLKTASWAISVAGATIGLIVLFLSGTWEHWFGR